MDSLNENCLLYKLIKIYEKGVETKNDDFPFITHYAKADSILNILSNKVIFSTDFRYLNDPLEIIYGIERVMKILESYSRRHPELKKACDMIKKIQEKDQYHILITSFVKHDDYLPCWRYYGDDGKGLSISFNRSKLQEGFKKRGIKSIFSDVIYEERKQEEFLHKLINYYLNNKTNQTENDPSSIIIILFLVLPIFKNPDWKDEFEMRCISQHIYMGKSDAYIFTPLPITKIVKESKKLQYRLFEFEYDEIEKVTLGPSADAFYLKNRIIAELLKVGVDKIPFKILKSERSYSSDR